MILILKFRKILKFWAKKIAQKLRDPWPIFRENFRQKNREKILRLRARYPAEGRLYRPNGRKL